MLSFRRIQKWIFDPRFTGFFDRMERKIQKGILTMTTSHTSVFNMAASKQMMCFVMLDEVCDESIENLTGDSNSDDGVQALLAQNQRKKRVRILKLILAILTYFSLWCDVLIGVMVLTVIPLYLHDYVPGSRLVRTQTRLDVCLQLIMLAHSGWFFSCPLLQNWHIFFYNHMWTIHCHLVKNNSISFSRVWSS